MAWAHEASCQAWTQPVGQAYLKLSTQRSAASEQFRADGTRAPYADGLDRVSGPADGFEDRSIYFYGEVGVTRGLTAVFLVPVKRLTIRSPHPQQSSGLPGTERAISRSASGIERVYVGLRWDASSRLGLQPSGRHRLALNVAARVPMGLDPDAVPAVGPGQTDLEAMLFYGASLWPVPAYFQSGLGYRVRTGLSGLARGSAPSPDYADEWLIHVEGGVNVSRFALLQGLILGTLSNKPPLVDFDPENPLPTRQRWMKAGAGVTLYPTPRVGLSLQVFYPLSGANTVRSTDWFLGVESRI